jgi:ATP-dependent Clp endopeptidase proteolytic subunit ClpP
MPVGVPQVAYSVNDDEGGEWIDLYTRMFVEGLLFYSNELDDVLANELIGCMIFLDSQRQSTSSVRHPELKSRTTPWEQQYNCTMEEWEEFSNYIKTKDWSPTEEPDLYQAYRAINSVNPNLPTQSDDTEIELFINSNGGSVTAGLGLFDVMRFLKTRVTTLCIGQACSIASLVLAGGSFGCRLSLRHAIIMMHQPRGQNKGQATEVLEESLEVLRIRRQIATLYRFRTGLPLEQIAADMDRDFIMNPYQARSYNLIDGVARPNKGEFKPYN